MVSRNNWHLFLVLFPQVTSQGVWYARNAGLAPACIRYFTSFLIFVSERIYSFISWFLQTTVFQNICFICVQSRIRTCCFHLLPSDYKEKENCKWKFINSTIIMTFISNVYIDHLISPDIIRFSSAPFCVISTFFMFQLTLYFVLPLPLIGLKCKLLLWMVITFCFLIKHFASW